MGLNIPDLLSGGLFDFAGKVLDRVIQDPTAKAAAQLELAKLNQNGQLEQLKSDTQLALGQIEVNKVEAASESLFKSGWRPAAGWMCVAAMGYQFLFRSIIGWVAQQAFGWSLPPSLEIDTLMTVLFGLLGLGAYRTVEKVRGTK